MLMKDKNGKEIKTGDIVKIEGAYFKVDNGLYFVDNAPGNVTWCGNDVSLKKIKRNGELSIAKYSTAFWPLFICTNNHEKNTAAREWNKEHATIEIIEGIATEHVQEHFKEEAENTQKQANYQKWNWGEDSEYYKKQLEMVAHYKNVVEYIKSKAAEPERINEAQPEVIEKTEIIGEVITELEIIEKPTTIKTSSGTYLLNKETQKIELHFEKSDYLALSDEQKKEIKSYFLWSRYAGAWVSRSTNNHYSALKIAEKLGLENAGKIGERLSYAEQLEVKAEKAEARAERYEQYANNAEARGKLLASALDKYRGDIAFFTQPIIAGHAGSRAFANYRERLYKRVEKGYEEYRKSEYYQDRAATARATADNAQLGNKVYLHNRIKEQNKQVKIYQDIVVKYEEALYKIQQGEELKNRSGEILTEDYIEQKISEMLEKYEWEHDKLEFFEKHLEEIGGIQFSKENIKVGYIVDMKRWGRCEIVSAGPVNVTFKILDGGAAGGILVDPYAAIIKIIEAKEAKKTIENPYQVGDILCAHRHYDNSIYQAYQVVKTTATGVKLQQIAIENRTPIKDNFISDKQVQKKVVKSKWSDWVGVYMDDWQLHKYSQKEAAAV